MEITEHGARWIAFGCLVAGACSPVPSASAAITVVEVEGPAGASSRLPNRVRSSDASTSLSWIEEEGAGVRLLFATSVDGRWSAPRPVASGDDWFVNWADFPSLVSGGGSELCAHWLRKSGPDTYAYEVRLALSSTEGTTWERSFVLHEDRTEGEHGFVSLVPWTDGYRAVWLDGRRTLASGGAAGSHGHAGGAMALFTRFVATDGTLGSECELDERVCDCCPTAALRTGDGALWVAYRDRSEDEVRDIALLRCSESAESAGELSIERVFDSADQWEIPGCPVNGPALASDGERVALAWFTLGGASAAVYVVQGGAAGFGEALRLGGKTVLGRVDALYDARGRLWVAWLDELDADRALWRAVRLEDGQPSVAIELADVENSRASGHGRWLAAGDRPLFAYTDVERSRVALVRVE